MAPNGKKENLLTSWKEIAAYLDRDVRTCIRWEKKFGLPVHRLDKDSKSKVFAYRDEIDRWLKDRSAPEFLDGMRAFSGGQGGRLLIVLVLLILAGAAYFLIPGIRSDAVPAGFHVRGTSLVVTNARGTELWHHDTGLADLEREAFYREHYQDKKRGVDYVPKWPLISIRDINGDGRPETLFSTQTASELNEGVLLCFNSKGRELWRFTAGRELAFGDKVYRREYRIFGFDVADYDGDGKPEILVISFHKPDWPCQVATLDASGNIEGEYWNSGYLMDAMSGDVDGDGKKEIVLAGVNNGYRRGCVIVFKDGNVQGSSPQDEGAYRSASLGPGTQSAYILFPTADFHLFLGQQGDPVNHLWIHDGGGMTGMTHDTQIYFDLNRRLECTSATLSNYSRNLYELLAQEGKVHGPLDKDYETKLAEDFLYYEKGAWVKKAPSL
jgi:hypothetical protein